MKLWLHEDNQTISRMRERLDDFYQSTNQYNAFHSVSNQEDCWTPVREAITQRLGKGAAQDARVRVLEFGAGRTGFAQSLPAPQRADVFFVAQDVTSSNEDFLREEADGVHVGDLSEIDDAFDVIFSTFVWEHVSNPRATLEVLLKLLAPNGVLFLFSPRYDVPFYRPAALRHKPKWVQLAASCRLWFDRARVRLGGQPGFWVTPDPAVLNVKKWFRDADAVHLVSLHDLRRALHGRATVTPLYDGIALKRKLLQLRVRILPDPKAHTHDA